MENRIHRSGCLRISKSGHSGHTACAFGLLTLLLLSTGCNGDDGGGGGLPPPPVPEGTAVLCQGTLANTQTGEVLMLPCTNEGASGCVPVAADNLAMVPCGVEVTTGPDGEARATVPGAERSDFEEGFCACKTTDVPIDQQSGSCQTACDEFVVPALNAAEMGTPWVCQATNVAQGEKAGVTCEEGSVTPLHGGPSDFTAQLVGSQTTSGSVDIV